MNVGYYLFAILFLMFDIETVLLYPWAVVVKQFGPMALVSIGFFLLVLVLAWPTPGGKEHWNGSKQESVHQEHPLWGVQGHDTLEKIAQELNEGGTNVVLGSLDAAINWGRSNSPWSLTFGNSCCGIEFMAVGCARYDFSRFGFEVTRNSPRQADLIMCAGTITNKMARCSSVCTTRWPSPSMWWPWADAPSAAVRSRRATAWCAASRAGARGCLHPRLPPASRVDPLRYDAAAA
jgi:NADH-quinone oxidoreductase subunit B